MVPVRLSPCIVASNDRSFPVSHWGGIEKLTLPLLKFTFEIGRALPPVPTNCPIKVCKPEWTTSSHEGIIFPELSIVISHRPSIDDVSGAALTLFTKNKNIDEIIE